MPSALNISVLICDQPKFDGKEMEMFDIEGPYKPGKFRNFSQSGDERLKLYGIAGILILAFAATVISLVRFS